RVAAIDCHTIGEELQHQGAYKSAGGLLYLSQLSLPRPSAAHIEQYAHDALGHAVQRSTGARTGTGAASDSPTWPGKYAQTWTPWASAPGLGGLRHHNSVLRVDTPSLESMRL